jgi:Yip1 domain
MTIVSDFNKSGLVERARNILLKPVETWTIIADEPATAGGLFTGYAAILAAIPPVAGFIGGQVFGESFLGRPPLITGLAYVLAQYLLSLLDVYVFALIVDALAPLFGGQKNRVQALKVVIYAYTAAWGAGIFSLIPALAGLEVLGGLYSLYLLAVGLPRVMHSSPDKTLAYTALSVLVGVILAIVVTQTAIRLIVLPSVGHISSSTGSGASGTIHIGGATIDLDKMNAATKQMEAAADHGDAARAVPAISTDILKGYLPSSFSGFARGDIETSSGGVAGFSGTNVDAEYLKGDAHLKLSITDLSSAGSFAAMAGAIGIESNKETANGYEKVGKVDGRLTTEEWDKQSKSGKYGVLVADRFMVEADGQGADMDDLKAAVTAVGPAKLETLAKK